MDAAEKCKRISDRLKMQTDRHFRSEDVTFSQIRILSFLAENGDCSMKELEQSFGVSQATMTGIMHRLEKKGLVRLHHRAGSRRVLYGSVTEKGMQMYRRAEQFRDTLNDRMFSGMDDAVRVQTENVLSRILQNLTD